MTTRSPTPVETMSDLLFGLVTGSGLTWALMSLCRDNYWREFNARRRGSNPPSPGRKPAPPAGPPSYDWRRRFSHENTNPPTGAPPLKLRRNEAPPVGPQLEQPLTAQLIRYWAWKEVSCWRQESIHRSSCKGDKPVSP